MMGDLRPKSSFFCQKTLKSAQKQAKNGRFFLPESGVLTAIGKRVFLTSTAPCSSGLLEF
jgi:hypothetical protein